MPTPADISGTNTTPATRITGAVEAVNNIFWSESTANLAISATMTGASRAVGVADGVPHMAAAFNAFVFASAAGTVRIEASNDGATWRQATANAAVGANAAVTLSVPIVARFYRMVFVNGAAAQTAFMANSSFTMA